MRAISLSGSRFSTLESLGNRAHRSLGTAAMSGCLICCVGLAAAVAGDWPQILGPHRNGAADGEKIQPWDVGGPRTLWTYPLGEGSLKELIRPKNQDMFR